MNFIVFCLFFIPFFVEKSGITKFVNSETGAFLIALGCFFLFLLVKLFKIKFGNSDDDNDDGSSWYNGFGGFGSDNDGCDSDSGGCDSD